MTELQSRGFLVSMARAGNPYENAMMKSFFKTLKYEEVYLCEYETFEDVVSRRVRVSKILFSPPFVPKLTLHDF